MTTFRRPVRAAAARRGAGGRDRPVRDAGRRRRPARDAARAHRRPAAAPPRPARQPERDARRDRPPDRPAQGRADLAPPTTAPGRRSLPRGRRAARASASSRRCSPPTTGCWARRARSTSATSSCTRSGCCARSRTCARGWPRATGTCSSTSCRTRASPRACCCGCWSPSTAGSPRSPTTTRRSTASAARRPRTSATSAPSGRWRRSCGSTSRCAPARALLAAARGGGRADRGPAGEDAGRRRGRAGGEVAFWRCASERAQAQAVAAEVERLIARERRRARGRLRARALGARRGPGGRGRVRGARGAVPPVAARRRSSSAPRCATCWPGCGCSSTRATRARSCARSRGRRSSCGRSTSRA